MGKSIIYFRGGESNKRREVCARQRAYRSPDHTAGDANGDSARVASMPAWIKAMKYLPQSLTH